MSETRSSAQDMGRSLSFGRLVLRRFRRSPTGLLGLGVVALLLAIGALAPVLASEKPLICKFDGKLYAPAFRDLLYANLPFAAKVLPPAKPFSLATFSFRKRMDEKRGDWAVWTPIPWGPLALSGDILAPADSTHWLGTDEVGRDLAARMVHGARVSMLVGFVSVGISTLIGLVLGSLAGYFGGWVDILISRVIEIVMCFPIFFLILTILAIVTHPSIWLVMCAIGVVTWTGTARYIRGEFIRLRDSEYAIAARALGASAPRVIFRHILPNSLAPIFVTVSFGIAAAIILEAALSFLGLGVQLPDPSWGNILFKGFSNILTATHQIWPPSVAIFIGVLGYNLVGDALRDAIDPRVAKT